MGYGLLLDNHKFISIFSDLVSKMKSERKMLIVALDQGIGTLFTNTPVSNQESAVRLSIRELQIIMSENAICTVISALIIALDLDVKLTELLPTCSPIEINAPLLEEVCEDVDVESELSFLSLLPQVVANNHISNENSS